MGVRLDDETRERLKKLGAAKQRSTHWLMKEAIHRYLEDEERYEREKAEDLDRWQRYLETGKAIPHVEVKARIDELVQVAARSGEDE
jgi:predicted transcriptional regulator